jgi:DNA-binding transcriptional ArsR family regulator
MDPEPDIARIASLLADPSRAAICLALCGDRALAAGELALRAGVSAQTASNHLAKLVGGRLATAEAVGRNRYYRLAGPQVAQAIEALAAIAPARRLAYPPDQSRAEAFRFARTCYDHLAGWLGVALADALLRRGWLRRSRSDFLVTRTGRAGLADFGIDVE